MRIIVLIALVLLIALILILGLLVFCAIHYSSIKNREKTDRDQLDFLNNLKKKR